MKLDPDRGLSFTKIWLSKIFWVALPVLFTQVVWFYNSHPFSIIQFISVTLLVVVVLCLPDLFWMICRATKIGQRPSSTGLFVLGLLFVIPLLIFALHGAWDDAIVFFLLSLFSAFLLFIPEYFAWGKRIVRAGFTALLAATYAGTVIASLQIIERFSEEEFFAAVQGFILCVWWLLLWLARQNVSSSRRKYHTTASYSFSLPILFLATLILVMGFAFVIGYQNSFFSEKSALYPGITDENPFFCDQVPLDQSSEVYNGDRVYQAVLERVAANPVKQTPDYGFLALNTSEAQWKQAFRQSLLDEVDRKELTGPANSIKFGQYEAALRAYFYLELSKTDRAIFTPDEHQRIKEWFEAINQRALTVEWVDWMYALAFGEWPEGPYLNQENGGGLLSILESGGLSDFGLREQNQAFLRAHPFGWVDRFRNTDDSIAYQSLWINNALFQSYQNKAISDNNVRNSFEWLLLQALPDGGLVGYNPDKTSLAGVAYLGAQLTGNREYLWLAGRTAEYAQENEIFVRGRPGVSGSVEMDGNQPEKGSCLLYGDSGHSSQLGPLAPDKIVFRDGWQEDDSYLNLNLRFTGWHRYKATNSIITVYKNEPLIEEIYNATPFTWLPVGRSLFRDKRVPRENLNGFLVERSGLSRWVFYLTGFGSIWAQDVPFYATVEEFKTTPQLDQSTTNIGWHHWQHTRKIFFFHDGPIVVIDEAYGNKAQMAGFVWHAIVPSSSDKLLDNRLQVGSSGKVEMMLIPLSEGEIQYKAEVNGERPGMEIVYADDHSGTQKLITIFLPEAWSGSSVTMSQGVLSIESENQSVEVQLP